MAQQPACADLKRRIGELEKEVEDLRAVSESILESERKYRAILDRMEDEYYEADLAGNFTFANAATFRNHGYPPHELIGTNYRAYMSPEGAKKISQTFKEVYRTGISAKAVNYEVIRKDGNKRVNEMSVSLIRDEKGEPVGFSGISRDRTELVQTEQALRESEESYRSILELAPDAIVIASGRDGRYVQVNDAFCQITGYRPEEAIGRTGLDLNLYPDPAERGQLLEALRRDGRLDGLEIQLQAKDGSVNDHLISARPIRFKGEDCVLVMATVITPLKQAQRALRESEEKSRGILESMDEGYWEVDLQGKLTFFNDTFLRLCGSPPPDALKGIDVLHYAASRESKRIYQIFLEVYKTGIPAEVLDFEVTTFGGSQKYIEMSVSLIRDVSGQPIGFRGVSRDRTQQRRAEKALKESEEKYRNILETMEEGYWEVDLAGNLTFFNDSMCRILGTSHHELKGMNNRAFSTPEAAKRTYGIFNRVYKTGIPAKIIDYELTRKDGSSIMVETSASLLRKDSGDPVGFRGITRDVTERSNAERALRESEEKYRLLVDNASEAIYITQDGVIKFPNPKTEAITGYSAEELAKKSFLRLVHPKDRDAVQKNQDTGTERESGGSTYSFRIRHKKGETLWVELNALEITWEGRPATLNFLRDITAQKRMEVQLLQARKMEAIGTLAGGIAHDFNNLLMGIQGNTSLMLLDVASGRPHYENLKSIEKMVQNGSGLTKQLLGVARGGKYEVKTTDLNQLIGAGADLFGRTRKEISIHKRLQEGLWPVEVDTGQIEQVLLNLYVNAWHAMPDGGELYIETRNLTLDQDKMTPYGLKSGKFVRVSVTDTGIGMDEATLKRVFDPFFTTKEMGRGTGLGLASAYGIIRNHNGIIDVYSEKGEGSTFNIYLPASDKQIQEKTVPVETVLKGTETILFVDDEDTVLQIGKRLLERLGYRVIEVTSGPKAIEIFEKDKESVHLVVLDMIMPGMGGGETYDRLREIDPHVKVLLSSGYSISGQAKKILDRGCKGFIQKPYDLTELSKRVRQALDR